MLICHVINSLNRGGAETHLFDLITEQIKNNNVVKIVAIGPDSKNIISLENEIANLGINIQRLNGPRMFNVFSYFSFANYLNKENHLIISQTKMDYFLNLYNYHLFANPEYSIHHNNMHFQKLSYSPK